ncbi:MAG: hypothetical protein N2316_01265 [Spirochaetes bacterium]|nr:hypothetical protein [Spirochaetota bacterium]
MKRIGKLGIFFVLVMLQFCASESSHRFSDNEPPINPSGQFDLLDEFPAIQDAFTNTDEIEQQTIDPYDFNQYLADGIAPVIDHLTEILPFINNTRNALATMMSINKDMVYALINQDSLDQDNYNYYATNLYDFLDDASAADLDLGDDVLEILQKVVGYIKDIHGSEIETVMDDLLAFLQQTEWPSLKSQLPLIQEGTGKLLVRTNSTIMDGATDTKLGKAVDGMDILLAGVRDIAQNDPDAREALYEVIREIGNVLTAKVGSKEFRDILRELMINLEDYATQGGSIYASNTNYYNDSSGVGTGYYVNTELRNAMRLMLPSLKLLFFRAKGSWESRPDYSIVKDATNGESPVEMLSKALYDLKKHCAIDFSDFSKFQVEPSLKRMVEYNGLGQLRSGASYKVSYLDHLLYTLKMANEFGFLTRKVNTNPYNDSLEPYQNNHRSGFENNGNIGGLTARLHGVPVDGIMTINDSLYSMTSGQKEGRSSSQNFTMWWLGAYNLALDVRVSGGSWSGKTGGLVTSTTLWNRGQGDYVFRSKGSFTTSEASNYKFYLGSDFPTLALLSGACAGDAGIPNGGRSGITPTSNDTTVGHAQNDFRTYYPYVGNGLGELNTGRWTMGWIARACWEGEGPYYYDPAKDPEKAKKDVPTVVISGTTYNVYYRPDGRIYALRSQKDGSYFYPVDGGNDVKDPSNTQLGTYWLRENRYRAVWDTDHYLIRSTHINYHDGNNHPPSGWTGYYAPNKVVGTGNTGLNRYRMHSLEGTTGRNQYGDDKDAYASASGALRFWEKIAESDPARACASQEEAMFRNFQWLMLEKKFVFIMPMTSFVRIQAVAMGMETCTMNLYIDTPVFTIIEANGLVGIATARKTGSVGTWVIKGTEGTDIDRTQPNGVNYGDSFELGDGRLWVLVKEDSSYDNIMGIADGDYVDIGTIWNTILGTGNVLPNVIGENIVAVARLGFLQSSYVASNVTGSAWEDVWKIRNKLLPVVIALAGTLHGKSYYEPPASGNWYNFASTNHKYPLKYLGDAISALASPLVRYYKTPYSGASKGWFVPQMEVATFTGYNNNFGFFTPRPVSATPDFKPKSGLRTVANLLTENSTAAADGLIPALANTKIVSKLLIFLQQTGQYGTGVLPIYTDIDKTSSDYTKWSARRKIFYGLEQILARSKSSQSIEYTNNYGTTLTYPSWFFTKGSVDVDIDIALDETIGADSIDKGIAVFVDYRDPSHPKYKGYNWNNFNKLIRGVGEILGETGTTTGKYCIADNIINVLDKSLTGFTVTDAHLKSLRHTLGTQMYQYNGTSWTIPQNLKNLVTSNLPALLTPFDGEYLDLLTVATNLLQDNGWVDYVITNISSSWSWEAIINDLYGLLGHSALTDPNSKFYDGLCERLSYFYKRMNDGDPNNDIYIRGNIFGSSQERAIDYLYSDEFDPYGALGEILSK